MTIQFNCPHCNAIIAFDEKHCGKRAQCLTCGKPFVIPAGSDTKPQKIKLQKEKRADPLPGFYRAAFIYSWKLFTKRENAKGLVFIIAVVCFKFFTAHINFTVTLTAARSISIYVPLGHVLHTMSWGILFWYYIEIIYSVAFKIEKLPELVMGGFYAFLCKIFKSVYTFFIAMLVIELPFLIAIIISKITANQWPVLLYVLMIGGLFLLPIAILTVAIGRDLTMLRPDYLLVPIFREFRPYLAMSLLLGIAGILQILASQYANQGLAAAGYLLLNLAVQVFALIAMQAIGLFYRHYSCHLPW